jgi:endoglucanase
MRPRSNAVVSKSFHLHVALTAALLCCVGFVHAVNPFSGKRLYVDPNSPARKQVAEWERSRPRDAALMRRIAEQPQAIWLSDWVRDVERETNAIMTRVNGAGALGLLVAYNIPHRDCGAHSAGGARNADAYRRWIVGMARGIKQRPSVVILEPDALANTDCLPLRLKDERYVLIWEAVRTLQQAGSAVYIDAGHAAWHHPTTMADRLTKAGVRDAAGFAVNVANYQPTASSITYGNKLSGLVGGKHYVIDTSRNGSRQTAREWCNPRNQALGPAPTARTGHALVDAFLWIKTPGQSDGTCGGGPRAGAWWADYALELSKAAEAIGGR